MGSDRPRGGSASVRTDIGEEPRADDAGDAMRDMLACDNARAVVAKLALRYRHLVRALKGQKLRTDTERLANWIMQTDARNAPTVRETEKRRLVSL
jgi:hypothetical protein